MAFILLTILIIILIRISAILNAKMDAMMIKYMDLTDNQKTLEHYSTFPQTWYSFDWRAKYKNLQNGEHAYNKLLLKLGIKTRFLTDNCNDAWHFYKSTMLVLLITAMCLPTLFFTKNIAYFTIQFCIFGIAWNMAFNVQLKKSRKV